MLCVCTYVSVLYAIFPFLPYLQACANIIIFAATNLVDVCYNYISDTARRKSFSETRRFICSLIAIGLENRKVVSGGRGSGEEWRGSGGWECSEWSVGGGGV